MEIIIGRGKNRHTFTVPTDKVGREKMAEDVKNFLFRPEMLRK